MKGSQFKPNGLPPGARGLGFLKSQDGDHLPEHDENGRAFDPASDGFIVTLGRTKNPSDR
jgi:hypothetical protein